MAIDLVKLVEEMRHAQKEYFRTKSQAALVKSIQAEKRVDAALEANSKGMPLFGKDE